MRARWASILVKVTRRRAAWRRPSSRSATLLRQRHHLQPHEDDDFAIRNLSEILASQEAASRVLSLLLAAVAAVSLVVGGIGIMNIMLVSVTERTREIGIRLAVGRAARRHPEPVPDRGRVRLAGGRPDRHRGRDRRLLRDRLRVPVERAGVAGRPSCPPSSSPPPSASSSATTRRARRPGSSRSRRSGMNEVMRKPSLSRRSSSSPVACAAGRGGHASP